MVAEDEKRSRECKKDGKAEKCIKTERSVLESYTTKSNLNRMERGVGQRWKRQAGETRRSKTSTQCG